MAGQVKLDQSSLLDEQEVDQLATEFETRPPQDLLRWAIGRFGSRLAFATSFQADGMVILDLAWRIDPQIRVITVDTGRLHQETYDLIERVGERYQIPIEIYYPDAAELGAFVGAHGINAFHQSLELRLRCCEVRKVDPLSRALTGLDAWIAGRRRSQSATRRNLRKVEIDRAHGGLIKLTPLADWTDEQVWAYIRANDVPHNTLYGQGYTSIGCVPCTRPTRPGDDPRSGRWWWETNVPKECGIHCRVDWATLQG